MSRSFRALAIDQSGCRTTSSYSLNALRKEAGLSILVSRAHKNRWLYTYIKSPQEQVARVRVCNSVNLKLVRIIELLNHTKNSNMHCAAARTCRYTLYAVVAKHVPGVLFLVTV